MSFEISLDIRRSPADVFAFIADFQNMPKWYEAVDSVTPDSTAPAGLGGRFQMVRSLPGGAAHNTVEVTSYEPDREVTFSSINGPTPFLYRYRLEPIPAGTRLTLLGDISAEGLPGPAAHLGGLVGRLFQQGMKKNLQVLKRILEK